MSGFKFDKNNEELDLSLGSDDALGSQKAAPKQNKTQLPKPSIQQPSNSAKKEPVKPTIPVAKPATQKPVQQPAATPKTLPQKPGAKPVPLKAQPATNLPKDLPASSALEPNSEPAPSSPSNFITPQEETIVSPEPVIQPTLAPPIVPPLPNNSPEYSEPYTPNINQAPQSPIIPNSKKQQSKTKTTRKKANNPFTGNRKIVLGIRIVAGVVASVIVFAGLNSILFPPNFPSPDQVISKVKEGLNITDFPTQKATGFVIDFTTAYFTVDPNNYGARDEQLLKYISKDKLQETDLVFNRSTVEESNAPATGVETLGQSIIGVPAIVNTYSIDNNNAVFTVQVALSTGTTMYVDVPVYWNPKNNGMAISAPLSIVPAIGLTTIPQDNLNEEWANDKDVVDAFEDDLKKYLEAWAASDKTSIDRYTTDKATLMAKLGLGGTVKLERLDSLEVASVDEEAGADPRTRNAKIDVVWKDANNEAFTYKQSYMLTIKQKPDEKWYVDNINSVVIK